MQNISRSDIRAYRRAAYAELEAFDKENEKYGLNKSESIKENKVINNLILRIITGKIIDIQGGVFCDIPLLLRC